MNSHGLLVLFAAAAMLAACDRSPQNADGATQKGDLGVAAATGNGTVADTGPNTSGGR
jgi:uncharacterized lipoprotein YajG